MINPDPRPNEKVHFAWFYVSPTVDPHYGSPLTCNPATPDGCLRELSSQGRFARNMFSFDGVWFDIGLIPQATAAPPADYYDAFSPIAHPASGQLMAVLLRVRE